MLSDHNSRLKKLERDSLAAKVEAFLANGGQVKTIPTGVSVRTIEQVGDELRAILNPPKRTRAEAQAELAKRHFKASKDQRRRAETETKPGDTPKRKRTPRRPKAGV
jgi:hypothetical protein